MLTPKEEAERLARECAKDLAMDSAHIPIIAEQILKSIPLAELIEAARAGILLLCKCDDHCAELADNRIECVHLKFRNAIENIQQTGKIEL